MANALYGLGRNKFARGDIKWLASGGDSIRIMLADSALYTPSIDADEWFSTIATNAKFGNSGGHTRADMPALTLIDPALGVCDANDVTITAVPAGSALEYLVIFKDSGVDGSSPLLVYYDTATGLPVTPNGGDINIVFDSGANKVFKL